MVAVDPVCTCDTGLMFNEEAERGKGGKSRMSVGKLWERKHMREGEREGAFLFVCDPCAWEVNENSPTGKGAADNEENEGEKDWKTFVFKSGLSAILLLVGDIPFAAYFLLTMSEDSFSEPEDEDDYNDYYAGNDQDLPEFLEVKNDPESHEYDCLLVADVEKLLNESVEHISSQISVTPSLAKVKLLKTNNIITT